MRTAVERGGRDNVSVVILESLALTTPEPVVNSSVETEAIEVTDVEEA